MAGLCINRKAVDKVDNKYAFLGAVSVFRPLRKAMIKKINGEHSDEVETLSSKI